jgi:hypothetical protein
MNIIKFNLPINTKLVGVKAVEKNELYFKTEIFPKILELGFNTDIHSVLKEYKDENLDKTDIFDYENIYFKEGFNEDEKNEFEKLFQESKFIDIYIEMIGTDSTREAYVVTKINDTIKHYRLS